MIRDILTNKWIIGAVFILLIVITGCILYYQQTTQADKQAVEQADKLLQQWKANKADKAKPTTTVDKEVTPTPAESTTTTAGKPTNKIGEETEETNTNKPTEPVVNIATSETDNPEEVKVSRFGFGPYPKVPDDYPGDFGRQGEVNWDYRNTPGLELITRVLVKLWTEGERNFRGGSTHRGKVYPHYYDTVYLHIEKTENGRRIHKKSGPFVGFDTADIDNPPPHIRILDLETSGIDPYQYLDLP